MVFNDPELIPLLSHAFRPANSQPYKPFLSDLEFEELSTPPLHSSYNMNGTSQYSTTSQFPATTNYFGSFPSHAGTSSTESSPSSTNTFSTPSQSSTDLNADLYEAEVRRELERRAAASTRTIHINIGDTTTTTSFSSSYSSSSSSSSPQSQSQQTTVAGPVDELDRRLKWAQQMILTNPALCAKACQTSSPNPVPAFHN